MPLKRNQLRSIHVPHRKNTMDSVTRTLPIPGKVYISMCQHIGAPCLPLVQKGDIVKVGQKIGDSDAYISAPVHSGVSGIVTGIEEHMSVTGTKDPMVVIKTDGKQELWEGLAPPSVNNREEFIKAVRESGIVGLGGAAFPLHVKYSPKNPDDLDTFIINGAECEPYITSDYRAMIEEGESIIAGIELVMKHLCLSSAYIGIESNKPEAIAYLTELSINKPIEVVTLRSAYPKGAERVLIYETTGRWLPAGKLPAEVGVVVSNVTSVANIASYFTTGMPLVNKRITLDGSAIAEPMNILATIGTKIYELIDFCGGYKEQPRKIIMGGPMMGRAIYDDGKPIIKNNNAILALNEEDALLKMKPETQCINCGRCHAGCPFDLMPAVILRAYNKKDIEELKALNVAYCMECGSCAYGCPAGRPLSLVNKMAKAMVRNG